MARNCSTPGRRIFLPWIVALLWMASVISVRSQSITSLSQLTQVVNLQPRTNMDIGLEVTVCAASRPEIGALIVQDDSGIELLQMGSFEREIRPGERVRIQGAFCLLRKRD